MQALQPAHKPWRTRGSAEVVDGAARAAQLAPSLERELAEALALTAQWGHGLGDAFLFGRCPDAYQRALMRALPAEARVFGCVEGARRSGRGRRWLDAADFDDRALSALRSRHYLQRVSVLVVADDFAWSLGRVVHGLRSLIATHAMLLVAGRQAALLETLWLDELRSGQRDFDVACMDEVASSWARFTLRRRPSA